MGNCICSNRSIVPRPKFPVDPLLEWNITAEQLKQAKRSAAELGYANDPRIVFLLAKRVSNAYVPLQPNSHELRPIHARCFELVTRFGVSTSDCSVGLHWHHRQHALHCILDLPSWHPAVGGVATLQQDWIPHAISFKTFCQLHPEWQQRKAVKQDSDGNSTCYVFFRDYAPFSGNMDKVLVQHRQIFGTCCAIHAPIVLQHYLVAMYNANNYDINNPAPTIDMSKWIRKHASSDVLEGIIFKNGVNADALLARLLVDKSCTMTRDWDSIPDALRKYGPLLQPMWRVTDEFCAVQPSAWQHLGTAEFPQDQTPRYHAMLVVGYRVLPDGTTRLLIQNWWHSKQFFEVDEAYYESCMQGGLAISVVTPQPRTRAEFDTTDATFIATAADCAGVAGIGFGPSMC